MADDEKDSTAGELWAIRVLSPTLTQVWTESGRLIADFYDKAEADELVSDHNIGVEMERPEPPEVVKTRAEQMASRLENWRVADPTGAGLLNLIMSASARLQRLLSLRAPNIIIVQSIETICRRAETLRGLYPEQDPAVPAAANTKARADG